VILNWKGLQPVGLRLLIATTRDRHEDRILQETYFWHPPDPNHTNHQKSVAKQDYRRSIPSRPVLSRFTQMSTATLRPAQGTAASRTARKPRTTTASLIASEFSTCQENSLKKSSKQEAVAPAPVTETQTASPVILVLIAFVVVTVLVKLSIGLTLITAKITKKIAHQIAAFWGTQMGAKVVDYRVYAPIFDL
jgi:hypothetical protein